MTDRRCATQAAQQNRLLPAVNYWSGKDNRFYYDSVSSKSLPGSFISLIGSMLAESLLTSFLDSRTHPKPTPPGTIPNCGLYYEVSESDTCTSIALQFEVSWSILHGMSCSSACRLLLD